ncbi:MAG: Holliday junction resolvase RuvX [Nannocystaceae bacterium]
MRALGLDVGSKTIGIAISDSAGTFATALTTLRRAGQGADATAVGALIDTHDVAVVVVGLPLELDGSEGHRARRVRVFLRALKTARGDELRTVLWDERFSTAAAERTLLEADLSRKKRKQRIDAVAAQFILQGWLDHERNGGGEAAVP